MGGQRKEICVLEGFSQAIGRVATAHGRAGGGCGRGRPLPLWGSGGVTPGKFVLFYSAAYEFLVHLKDRKLVHFERV